MSQKACVIPEPHAKNEVQERPIYAPKDDEILIKITATAINPVDWKMRDYNVYLPGYPAICGSDAAGEVAAVGSFVKDFSKGQRVFFQGRLGVWESSTFQQYCTMPAELVAHTPSNISDEQAAGISLASLAVVTGYYHGSGGVELQPLPWEKDGSTAGQGRAIVILGGSSSVGQYAIQLARLSGFQKIVTASSPQHIDYLKQLGATDVLDRHSAKVEDYVNATSDRPLHFVYDSISDPATQLLGVQILQRKQPVGTPPAAVDKGLCVVTVLGVDEKAKQQGIAKDEVPVSIHNVLGIGSSPLLRPLAIPFMKALSGDDGWIAKGEYVANKPVVVPGGLNGLEDALAKNKDGVSGVKIIIKPQETS